MHEQMKRLYQAAQELKSITGQSELARKMETSPQVIKNWQDRGVSKRGMLDAQKLIGCSASWIETGEGEMLALPSGARTSELQGLAATKCVATLGQTLERLGEFLNRVDEKTRNDVATLLLRFAQNPAEGKRLAQAIEILLSTESD